MEPGKGGCATCTGLIRTCASLDYFPSDLEVRRLLVERLHRLARSHEHAAAMIDAWLETKTAAPKIADLVALANQVSCPHSKSITSACAADTMVTLSSKRSEFMIVPWS